MDRIIRWWESTPEPVQVTGTVLAVSAFMLAVRLLTGIGS